MDHSPGFLKLAEDARSRVREIDPAAAHGLAQTGAVLLDVREESEWAAGRAAGAQHLGRGILERDAEKRFPDPATPILCYCGGAMTCLIARWHSETRAGNWGG